MKTITQMNEALFVHLSNDCYDISIVHTKRVVFKIRSEEKISFYGELLSLKKEFMQKNTTVSHHYLIVVDINFAWNIYCLKTIEEQPRLVYKGKLMSEKWELKRIINVHQIDGKIVFLMNQFKLLYVSLPHQRQQEQNFIFSKEFVPFGCEPEFQHSKFSLKEGFLPKGEEYQMHLSHYQTINQSIGVLFLVYKSNSNRLYSIYTLEYLRKDAYFVSSKNILYNIQNQIIAILPTNYPDYYIVQSTKNLILWNIGQRVSEQSKKDLVQIQFTSRIVKVVKNGDLMYIGATGNNKIITIRLDKNSKNIKSEQLLIANLPLEAAILQIYPNLKSDQHYLLTKKQEFLFLSKKGQQKIIFNEYTKILKSRLQIDNSYNFLIINKLRGKQQEKIIYGNHLFTYNLQHYMHGLMIGMSQNVFVDNSAENIGVWMTSPLVGLKKMIIALKKKETNQKRPNSSKLISTQAETINSGIEYQVTIDKTIKLSCEQTLFLNTKYQITAQQIIQLGKKNSKISKLFDNATDYISKALVLSDLFVLVISQQIHVYDSKLVRKYIYCCNSEIKNIYALNDYNVIGIEQFENNVESEFSNELMILILEEQKANKIKKISIEQIFKPVQLSTVINTAEHKLNLFGNKVVVCSNDSLHRYQIEKIIVEQFQLPLPTSNLFAFSIIPYYSFTKEKNNVQFVVLYKEEETDFQRQFEDVQIYFGSFSPKYLFKKVQFKHITVSYERVLTLSQLPKDKVLFAAGISYSQGSTKNMSSYRSLLLIGEKFLSICGMKFGRLELQWLQDRSYIQLQLTKIQSFPNQLISQTSALSISKPIKIVATLKKQYILLHNSRQIYYANRGSSKIQLISYYSLMNDDFVSFRNNLNINEINDEAYMNIFNQKLVIKDIKYLNDRVIFVLYQICIIVLEVGYNNSLVVRQEIKFKSNDITDIIQIEQLLQNYDDESIYLRQKNARIFVLKKVEDSYQIVFHSFMDEDVLLFSRVSNWNHRQRIYKLTEVQSNKKEYEELVLKKDGQLIIKSLGNKIEETNKFIYL